MRVEIHLLYCMEWNPVNQFHSRKLKDFCCCWSFAYFLLLPHAAGLFSQTFNQSVCYTYKLIMTLRCVAERDLESAEPPTVEQVSVCLLLWVNSLETGHTETPLYHHNSLSRHSTPIVASSHTSGFLVTLTI